MNCRIALLALLLLQPGLSVAQCLTDFKKLLPEEGAVYDKFAFGYNVSVGDDVLAIGSRDSDTLGYTGAGVVYLYTKTGDDWRPAGILKPNAPVAQMQFGTSVQVGADYIVVGAGSNQGIYIYRKPPTGWTTATETARIKPSATVSFGNNWDFDEGQNLLAVHDESFENGVLYVYHKTSGEWDNSIVPQVIPHPKKANGEYFFGIGGVKINGDRIASGIFSGIGSSKDGIFVFRDPSGNFNNYQLEAELSTVMVPPYLSFGPMFEFNDTGIIRYGNGKFRVYNTPVTGTWANDTPYCDWNAPPVDGLIQGSSTFTAHGQKIYVSSRLSDGSSRLLIYERSGGTWCSTTSFKVIFSEPSEDNGGSLLQRSLSVYDDKNFAFSWTSAANDVDAYRSVGVINLSNNKKQFFVKAEHSAQDTRFGGSIWASGDVVFASATGEYVKGKRLGAVYIYQKSNGQWQKVNKLTAPVQHTNYNSFGGFVTGNGEFVAVSGLGSEPEKVFVYKRDGADLTHPVIWQTLDIPGSDKEDYDYTKPVMTDNWLVLPVANYSDGSEYLVFYKKNSDGQWAFAQKLKIGNLMIFFKLPHHVAMHNGTVAVTNGYDKVFLLEFNTSTSQWEIRYTLTQSDPDRNLFIPASPPIPALYANGSYFGYSIEINENQIFVGAPGKDDGASSDVGAVYMYAKSSAGTWQSGTETKKLLPAIRTANTNFGTSMALLNNTLAVGATTTNAPGAVYIFNTADYYWNNITQLLRLTGDTFAFDAYGGALELSDTDFFIGASRETNNASSSAGAVYITPAPAMIKLEPPICLETGTRDLFGYPFDGVWSGAGIVDAAKGTFDPAIAGLGKHTLTYVTSNCFYNGKLEIQVAAGPDVHALNVPELTICDAGVTSVTIGVSASAQTDVSYLWFYRDTHADSWAQLTEENKNEVTIGASDKPGNYKVETRNNVCSIVNEFSVVKEQLTITLQPLPLVCDDLQRLDLNASVDGGIWEVMSIQRQVVEQGPTPVLRVDELGDGTYTLRYSYQSEKKCVYIETTPLTIDRMKPVSLVADGNLCNNDLALSLGKVKSGSLIEWIRNGELLSEESGDVLKVDSDGEYYAVISKNTCSIQTNPVLIDRVVTSVTVPDVITPNGDSFNESFQAERENVTGLSLLIMDRNGSNVFNTSNADFKWNAPGMPEGVYYYLLKYKDCQNEDVEIKGWLQVIR